MSVDPRKTFSVKACPRGQTQQQTEQQKRKGFLDSITKIGDLEVLNDIGFGKVGEGLRTLASVSDSIRSGESVVPGRKGTDTFNSALGNIVNTAADAVDQGAQVVLDTTGLGNLTETVGEFHPQVANRAYGQAKQIYEKVKQGEFELSDIPEVFSDLQNLEQLGRGIFGTSDTRRNATREYELCQASPYARDLIAFAPKFNFLFVIDVQFSSLYQEAWKDIGSTMAFVVKRSTRPEFTIEYEDVNMYNFRTRVPKHVTYPNVRMSFYDDNKNAAHLFYTAYMRAMSPIANMLNGQPETLEYEQNSMNFAKSPASSTFDGQAPALRGYSASLGPLLGTNTKSILNRIRLFHIFDYGRLMNIYNFYNPRIVQFTPTELNMAESGDGAEFEFEFAYDGLFIEPGFSVQQGGREDVNLEALSGNHGKATYPIKPVFQGDPPPEVNSQQSLAPTAQVQKDGAPSTDEAFRSSLGLDLVSQSVASAGGGILNGITEAVEDAFGNVIGTVKGAAGSAIAGARGALSGVTGAIAGAQGAVNEFTSGVTGRINDALASAPQVATRAKSTISNAFKQASGFTGSFFG